MYPNISQYGGYNPLMSPSLATGNTYTPSTGNTQAGQQLMQLNKTLQSITGMSSPDVQNLQQGSQQQALQLQANQPQYMQQEQQNIGQALGIPGLVGQYGNMSQLFDLFLHDNSMSQKYGSVLGGTGSMNPYANPQLVSGGQQGGQQLQQGNQADIAKIMGMTTPNQPPMASASTPTTPISGQPNAAPNPYLASSQDIVSSVQDMPQAPSLTTSQMAQPLGAGVNMTSLLNSLLGAETGLQGQKLDLAGQNYTGILNAIQSVANLAGTEMQNRQTNAQNAVNFPGTTQQAGSVFQQIIDQIQKDKGNQSTENDIWNYINQHDSALRAQGVNVDELWKLHKDLADKVGTGGLLSGGKESTFQAKKLPNGQLANFDPKSGKYFDPNTGQPLNLTSDQVQAAQDNVDTANAMMQAYQQAGPLRFIPGAEHLIPGVATAQSKMFQSLGSLRRGAIGGRITQQEINWLTQKLFPGPYDTPDVMQAKVQALQDTLTKFISDPNAHINSDGNVSSGGSPTITIKNKKTGQTLTIPVSEKGKYGL